MEWKYGLVGSDVGNTKHFSSLNYTREGTKIFVLVIFIPVKVLF